MQRVWHGVRPGHIANFATQLRAAGVRLDTKWGFTPGEVDGLFRTQLLLPLTDHLRRSGIDGLDVATCAKAAGARPIRMRHPGGTAR